MWRPLLWHHRQSQGYTASQWPCWYLETYRSATADLCSAKKIYSGKDIPGWAGHEPDSEYGSPSAESTIYLPSVLGHFPSLFRVPPENDDPAYSRLVLIEQGFPFRAFRCTVAYTFSKWWDEYQGSPNDATQSMIDGGLRSPFPSDSRERVVNEAIIPLKPLWSGVLLDVLAFVLMYGCSWWFLRLVGAMFHEWSLSKRMRIVLTMVGFGLLSTFATSWISAAVHRVDWISGRDGYWDMARALDGGIYSEWELDVFREPTSVGVMSRWWKNYHTGNRQPRVRPEALVPSWAKFALPIDDSATTERLRIVDGRGWPFVAMWSAYEADIGMKPGAFWLDGIHTLHAGIELKPHDTSKIYGQDVYPMNARILPLGINPVGFAFDAVFHGGIAFTLFVLAASPWTTRRVRRRRRGVCLKCGYDLRGNLQTGCPECGWRRDNAESPNSSRKNKSS